MNACFRFCTSPRTTICLVLMRVWLVGALLMPVCGRERAHAVPQSGRAAARHANSALDKELVAALEHNADLARIRALLQRGADPNAFTDSDAGNVLHLAAYNGRTDVVKLLLARHAEPNKRNIDNVTPLGMAAIHGDVAMVQMLIANGARVKGWRGRTALMDAASAVNIPVVRYLLMRHDVRINAEDTGGATALSEACSRNANLSRMPQDDAYYNRKRAAFTRSLMQQGAHINNRAGQSPALLNALWNADLARLLVAAHANVETRDGEGQTALHKAALGDNVDEACLEMLLKAGANVNARDKDAQTPLLLAAQSGSAVIVNRLLAAGADRSLKDKNGRTALALAQSEKHPEIAALLTPKR